MFWPIVTRHTTYQTFRWIWIHPLIERLTDSFDCTKGFTQSTAIGVNGCETVTCRDVGCPCRQAYPPGVSIQYDHYEKSMNWFAGRTFLGVEMILLCAVARRVTTSLLSHFAHSSTTVHQRLWTCCGGVCVVQRLRLPEAPSHWHHRQGISDKINKPQMRIDKNVKYFRSVILWNETYIGFISPTNLSSIREVLARDPLTYEPDILIIIGLSEKDPGHYLVRLTGSSSCYLSPVESCPLFSD